MKTVDYFQKKTVLSYEVFPPKNASSVNTIYDTLRELKELSPDFISVTYGAGGGNNNSQSIEIASVIKSYGIESVMHLPCIGLTKEDVSLKLRELKQMGIENLLALRGDIPNEDYIRGDFKYASDLIAYIKSQEDFNILAACYPEGHTEAKSIAEDIRNLKKKVDAGANQLVTQLFFDNDLFYSFKERCLLADINIPIEAGIMPIINRNQIERMVSLCGASLPKKVITMMERFGDNPIAMRDAGIDYAINQITDLVAQDVDGIHLYTMNNPYIARRIHEVIHRLI